MTKFGTASVKALAVSFLLSGMTGFSALAQNDDEADANDWDVSNPPGEQSSVNIDVSEGTWMNVDVSPDGQMIVFDMLGDIYTMPLSGGTPTNISSGMSWDQQPRYSPDGGQIAFTSDRAGGDNIWVMAGDGSNTRQITKENFRLVNNPAWSPDGNYIIGRKHYTTRRSMGTGEIWAWHVGGGSGVAVYERPNPRHQKDIGEPTYSPDGNIIYFSMNTTSGGVFEYAQDSNTQIYEIRSINLTTGEILDVISGPGGAVRPTISPDGTKIAFIRRVRAQSSLFIKDLESGEVSMLYRDMDQDLQETWAVQGVYPNMDWTPDGENIVFWAGGKINSINLDSQVVSDIPFHIVDTRMVIAPPRPTVEVAPDRFNTTLPRWAEMSPDGERMIFESLGRIYIKNVASGRVERLTSDESDVFEAYPSYSRDGNWVVYVTWNDQALGTVNKIRARGGRSTQLSQVPGHYVNPQMSPDNEWVVVERVSAGRMTSPLWSDNPGIYKLPAEGGELVLVSDDGSDAHFGPENDRIYLQRFEDEHLLVSINMEGEDVREHASSKYAIEMAMAPSGDYIAFVENWKVFVAARPHTGGSLSIGPGGGGTPSRRIDGFGGRFLRWAADGSSIGYSAGPRFFNVAISDAFAKELGVSDDDFTAPETGINLSMNVVADKPTGTLALVGARLITMGTGATHVIENGTIIVEGNRVAAVGTVDDIVVPRGATVMDVTGKTIIPGLVDSHAHGAYGTNNLIPQQNYMNYATLALGVTTDFNPSTDSLVAFSNAEYQRAGLIVGPRLFSTGEIVYGAKGEYYAEINDYDDALGYVRRLHENGALGIKNYNQPRREQRQQIVTAARELDMLVVPEGGALFSLDMSLIADGNSSVEHSLAQQAIYEDVLQFWSGTDVSWNMTLVVNYGGIAGEAYWYQHSDVWKHPILSRFVPPHILQPRSVRRQMAPEEDYAHFDNARQGLQLMERGTRVLTGAHGQREGLGTHWEMWLFADGGASPMQALHAATVLPAQHLGMYNDIGSLEVGKLADLVILNANPLENIRNSDQISHVMLNGRLYDVSDMSEVITGDNPTEPFYWWGRPEAEIR
jgi:imidazolonepropionase-like amidohydrolase/Tol biopolymer transport system component